VVEPDPKKSRGKVVRLTARGFKAQQTYYRLVVEIEQRWEKRFGKDEIYRLRESLLRLFTHRNGDVLSLAAGLIPPQGTVREGSEASKCSKLGTFFSDL
jgi:hypothetical protein